MNIEVFRDKDFIRSVKESGGVWVLFSGQAIYALPVEAGNALPVWVSKDSATVFAAQLERSGLSPVFVPLDHFIGSSWLCSTNMNIVEILASPKHDQGALTYTAGELCAVLKRNKVRHYVVVNKNRTKN